MVPRVRLDYGNVVYVDARACQGVRIAEKLLLIEGHAGSLEPATALGA